MKSRSGAVATRGRVRRRARDRRTRENDFLAAAERLFGRRGFHATSMEEIAAEAGYATGTIYLYFPSKKALFQSLQQRQAEAYLGGHVERVGKARGAMAKLSALVESTLGYFDANRDTMKVYVQQILPPGSDLGAELNPTCRQIRRRHMDLVRSVFVEGMEEGVFRRMDPDLLVTAFAGVLGELALSAVREGKPALAAYRDFVLNLFTRGIAAQEKTP